MSARQHQLLIMQPPTGIIIKVKNETLQLSEARIRSRTLVRVRLETLNLSETKLKVKGIVTVFTESLQLSEGKVHVRGFVKVWSENLQLLEVPIKHSDLVRIRTETLALLDQALRIMVQVRIKNEALTVQEAICIPELYSILRIAGIILQATTLSQIENITVEVQPLREREEPYSHTLTMGLTVEATGLSDRATLDKILGAGVRDRIVWVEDPERGNFHALLEIDKDRNVEDSVMGKVRFTVRLVKRENIFDPTKFNPKVFA